MEQQACKSTTSVSSEKLRKYQGNKIAAVEVFSVRVKDFKPIRRHATSNHNSSLLSSVPPPAQILRICSEAHDIEEHLVQQEDGLLQTTRRRPNFINWNRLPCSMKLINDKVQTILVWRIFGPKPKKSHVFGSLCG